VPTGTAERGDRLHAALSNTFEAFFAVVPEASFERRAGHSRLSYPYVPLALFNGVIVESEPCTGVMESLREVETMSGSCGVQLREGRHEAVEAEVARHGLTTRTAMPGMASAPDELVDARVDELTIGRATDEAALAEAARVAAAGFGSPVEAIEPLYTSSALSLDGFAVYVGRVAGEAVTTGMGYRLGREVAIFSVATPPEHRRRGYGGAISAHAARTGFAEGADLAWLQTSELGERVYRRLGFRHVVMHWLLTRPTS
jgi:ribosomal protein S18 acetylase RimI-like enzyme